MGERLNFYIWEPYIEGYKYASALGPVNLEIEVAASIAVGQSIEVIPEGVVFENQTPGPVPDVMSTGGSGLLVSQRIYDSIKEFCNSDEIQYIPAALERVPSELRWLVNPTVVLSCINREESELTYFQDYPDSIDGIANLVPLTLAHAPALFHMQEIVTTLVVREDLMSRMRETSSTCADFIPLHEFTRTSSE